MDCSLSTWPSITQFDDFVWTGFGDIDPLESLERTKNNNPEASAPAISSHQVTKPSSSCDTLLCNNNTQNMHSQSTNFYTISPSESLVARRWESMNAVDLTSVLETAFPSEGVLSTPTTEDGYALYSDEMLMQPEQQLGGEVDVFMDDPLSEVADAMFATPPCDDILKDISSVCNDSTSLPSSLDQMDCKCSTVDSDTSGFINPSTFSESPVDDTHRSMVSGVDCTVQSMEASEVLSSNPAQCGDIIQSLDYYPLSPLKLTGSRDVRTANQSIGLDSKDLVTVQQHDCTQSSTMSQWSTSQLRPKKSLKLDGGKYVHQCTVQVGDGYPGSASPQAKLIDAARLSSELKLNRAQVSRARRLAASQRRAEGRAKKYPLQKLIRMSSSTACARDRLGNSLDTSVPTLHPPVHMVVQTQLPGGGQSLPMSTVNLQTPTLLPVVFQAPQMASSHNLHTHMNPVQVSPRYRRYRQQQLMAPSEDNSLSSGSSAAQYPHAQQAMRSLTMGLQSLTNSANSLDATLLEQLQFVLNKMNRELRLGIRDALYRLAKSANQRQNRVESASYSDSNSSHIDPVETQTNSVDRWIVNLLFCKQPSVPEAKYQSYLPIPSNATSQSVLESASISISQPWNSCGSFLNLQEQPPHVMTGS